MEVPGKYSMTEGEKMLKYRGVVNPGFFWFSG